MAKEEKEQYSGYVSSSSGGSDKAGSAAKSSSSSSSGKTTSPSSGSSDSKPISKAGSIVRDAIAAGARHATAKSGWDSSSGNSGDSGAQQTGYSRSGSGLTHDNLSAKNQTSVDVKTQVRNEELSYLAAATNALANKMFSGEPFNENAYSAEAFAMANQINQGWKNGVGQAAVVKDGKVVVEPDRDMAVNEHYWYSLGEDGKKVATQNPVHRKENLEMLNNDIQRWTNFANSGNFTKADVLKESAGIKQWINAMDDGLVENFQMEDGTTVRDYLQSLFDGRESLLTAADRREAGNAYEAALASYNDAARGYLDGITLGDSMFARVGELETLGEKWKDDEVLGPAFAELLANYGTLRQASDDRNFANGIAKERQSIATQKEALQSEIDKAWQNILNSDRSTETGESMSAFIPNQAEIDELVRHNELQAQLDALDVRAGELDEEMFQRFASEDEKQMREWLKEGAYSEHYRELAKAANPTLRGNDLVTAQKQLYEKDQQAMDALYSSFGIAPQYFTTGARVEGAAESAGIGILAVIPELASYIGRAGQEIGAYAEATKGDVTPQSFVEFDRKYTEVRNQAEQFDAMFGDGAYASLYGNGQAIDAAREEIGNLEAQQEKLLNEWPAIDVASDDVKRQYDDLDAQIRLYEKQIKAWEKEDRNAGLSDHPTVDLIDSLAKQLNLDANTEIAKALQNATKGERVLVQGTKTGLEMGFDTGVALITAGGSRVASLATMAARVFAQETQHAYEDGATLMQQTVYGTGKAAVEVFTESMFGMFDKIGYSKGLTAQWVERFIANTCDTPLGMTLMRTAAQTGGEGLEELVAGIFAPAIDKVYRDESLKDLAAEEWDSLMEEVFIGSMMGGLGSVTGIAIGQNTAANQQAYVNQLNTDIKTMDSALKQRAEQAKAVEAPKGSTAYKIIQGGSAASAQQNQRINAMLNNGAEVRNFERQTGMKIEGTTNPEKRASVYKILAQYEQQQAAAPEIDEHIATRTMRKIDAIAAFEGKTVPEEMKLTPDEAKVAKTMGVSPEDSSALTQKQSRGSRTEGMEGYVQRFSESPFMQKIRESTQNLLSRKNQVGEEAKPIDKAGTMKDGEAKPKPKYGEPGFVNPMGEDVADDSGKVDASKVQVDSMGEIVGPEKAKTEKAPTAPERAQGEEQAPDQQETPPAPVAPVKPKGKERQSDLGSKAARQEQREQNRRSHAQLQRENRQRQEADNAAINKAYDNRESGKESKVSFEGTFKGKPATITYDAGNSTLTFTREDGTSETRRDVGKRLAKKLVNKARSTLDTGEAQPSKASFVVEETNEEVDVPEASGPDERIVSAIRNAKDIGELERLYGSDPDAFADAYEAVAGKPLSHGDKTADEITELYDTLHLSEEAEPVADEAEGEEETPAPTESEEEEVPAEPAEEIAESEEESEPVEAEEPVEAAEAEEEAPELPEGPLKDRLHAGQVSDTEVTTRLSNPATRKELKAELGLPSNASEAVVRNAVKIAALDHDQVMDDLQNGRFVAANIQALVRTGKVTAEELSGVLRDAGIIGKKSITGLPTLERRYIQLQAKVNPDALTDADRAKLATQTKHDATVKKTNEETAADLKELTQARLDQKGDDTSASALYKEFTDDDRQAYKQQGADLITKGKLSAEEIVQLITKDSEALANYAAKTGHNPQQVRLALIEGYNQLTQDDIGLYGEKYAVKKVEEAIRQFRGSNFTVANYAGSKKKTDIETLKEDQDVTGVHSERDVAGRVATSKRGVAEAFGRILGDPAWAASFGGTGLGDAEGAAHYWEAETSAFTKVGGVNLGYSDLKGVTKKAVDRLLTGLEGKPESRIPLVTVIDASNISEKDFNNVMGFVSEEGSSLGIWLIVNPPVRGKTAPGVVLLHEPVHYFLAKWREEQMGPEGKSFKEPMSLNFVASLVQRFNKANSISIVGTKEEQIRSLVKSAQSLISRELSAYGRGLLSEYGVEFEDDEWDVFKDKQAAQQFAEIKTELNAIGEDYDSFFQRLVEELTANIAAGNEALDGGVFKVSEYKQAMRDLLYESGYVPTGFFENLDSVSAAWTKEANKKASGKLSAGKKANGVKALKDISPEMHELQDLSRESTEQKQLQNRQFGFIDTYNNIEKLLAKLEKRDPHFIEQPTKPIDDLYANPDSYEKGVRRNTPMSHLLNPAERAEAGEVGYEKYSVYAIKEAAEQSIDNILADPNYGFDELARQLLAKDPRSITRLEQQMLNSLAQTVKTQREYLLARGGAVYDSRFSTDTNLLWTLEERFREHVSIGVGEAMAKGPQQRASLTPEQEVLRNLSEKFLDDQGPLEIEPDSIGAKMYDVGATMVDGVEAIDARREAGEIDEKQAVSEMLAMVREINKVRDVAKTFGPAGEIMAKWEQACLNRIANKAGEDAYDTLKMIALGSINRISSDFDTVGITNTIKQVRYLNLLSNPATKVSNILNNFESSLSGAIGQNVGVALAGKRAQQIMGGDVPMLMSTNWHRGLVGKTNKELNDYMLTKGAESVLALYYGLDVDEGVVDIDLGAKHNQNGTAASRLLATFQFISGLGMTTTDAMAIARAYRGMEMKIDAMEGITEARRAQLKADAMIEARRQMYHGDSKASKAMENLRDAANAITIIGNKETGAIGLGDILMPFVQVPTNVAIRAMKATPVGVVYGIAKYWQGMNKLQARRTTFDRVQALTERKAKGVALNAEEMRFLKDNRNVSAPTDVEVRKLMRGLGESCTNAAATTFGALATLMGALRDFDDEDDEALKRLAKERNFTGLQLNLSKLFRLGKGGWKKDDLVIGGSWLQVLAIPLVAGHQIAKDWWAEDRTAEGLVSSIVQSPLSTFQTFVDAAQEIPGITQIADIWDAYENLQNYDLAKQKNKVVAGIGQYAANAASTFVIPNVVAQYAAGSDNRHRDIYRADTTAQIMANIWKSKLPGNFLGIGRETIPEMKSSLGETRTYGSNKAMGIVNRMFLPGTGAQRWIPSRLEEEYTAMSEALKGTSHKLVSAVPTASPPKTITSQDGNEYTLNAEETRSYDDEYTEGVVRLHYQLMDQPGYADLTWEQKFSAMNQLRQFEDHAAKIDYLVGKGDDSGVKIDNWEKLYIKQDELGSSISNPEKAAQYAAAYAAATEIYSSKTRSFTGSDKTDAFLDNVYSKLDDDQKAAFDGSFPNMDKLYEGHKEVGLTAKEFEDIRADVRRYDDLISNRPKDVSETAYQRDMMKEWEQKYSGKKLDWIVENNRIWRNRPVSTETIDKFTGAGLSITEADGWLDRKEKLVPPDDYKSPPMNQVIQSLASYGEMSDKTKWITLMTDGDVTESARNNLGKYKLEHPDATLQEAIDNVSYWYKDAYSKKSKWEERFYSLVYSNPNANRNKEYPFADELAKRLGLSA